MPHVKDDALQVAEIGHGRHSELPVVGLYVEPPQATQPFKVRFNPNPTLQENAVELQVASEGQALQAPFVP